ncbi:MAG: recombinase family protein [Candidatus Zixiibacteriota bacterium]
MSKNSVQDRSSNDQSASVSIGTIRCAIYTRKSTEEGLDQAFNSLDAQREACEAYIASQRHEGWTALKARYDDGGFSGGNIERPGLKQLLAEIRAGAVDIVVVYKVDRLTRSLADFSKIIECFDGHGVSFVAVTQQFNTTTSMGRLTLNVLLSFAQFEREVTGERIRDKIAASKAKGMWMGGHPPLGYDAVDKRLVVNSAEADRVRLVFAKYLEVKSVRLLQAELSQAGIYGKARKAPGKDRPDSGPLGRGALYRILTNPTYIGKIVHRGNTYDGTHERIIDQTTWVAVQALLTVNRKASAERLYARAPSPLAGRVFDENGCPFTPSHTVKDGKRYRYYVRQSTANSGSPVDPSWRIPASELEAAIAESISHAFASDVVAETSTEDLALQQDPAWRSRFEHARNLLRSAKHLQTVIRRATVRPNELHIDVDRDALLTLLQYPVSTVLNGKAMSVQMPYTLSKRGGSVTLAPEASHSTQGAGPNKALVKLIVRARMWNRRLLSEPGLSITALAREEEITDAYIRHFLPLAFLDPTLVTRLLDGAITLTKPVSDLAGAIPYDWSDQQRLFVGV